MMGKFAVESNKRRAVGCINDDRISNLPEHLRDSILERLHIQDAVRTSILSKNWRYRWTNLKELVFDKHFSTKFSKDGAFCHNGFIRIINKVLIHHTGSILKFYLYIPNMNLDSFQEVDQFILLLSRKGITELNLTNRSRRYELSYHLFSCLSLTKLILVNCFFKPPLEFKVFPNLEEIWFAHIDFGAINRGTDIYLPQLKKLFLDSCINVSTFNIRTTKLCSLSVTDCPDAMLIGLCNSPCLDEAIIYFRKPTEYFVRVENMNFAQMLSYLPRIRNFVSDRRFIKFLIAKRKSELLPDALYNLQHLGFVNVQVSDLEQLYGVLFLLRSSPNLKTFRMQMTMEPQVNVGAGPASSHLESSNCLDCKLNQLQTIQIKFLEGSRSEILFIKLLLAHSPSLQKFTIAPSLASDIQKRLDIAKDIMQFPRASTMAKIFYLDPKP